MKYIKTVFTAALMLALLAAPIDGQARKKTAKSTSQVIYTGEIASKVYGYNGKTPLNIHIKNGKIERIEVLPNDETPQYLKRATAKILPQYEGKSVAEAKKLHVDAVTGATYSSEAIIKNIQMGLEHAGKSGSDKSKSKKKRSR